MSDLEFFFLKCNVITFSAIRSVAQPAYYVLNNPLSVEDKVDDLGVTFTSRLKFNEHTDNIARKANKLLGFLERQCKKFCNLR